MGAAVVSTARAETVAFTTPGEQAPFTVPAGVSSIHVVAIGGRGGNGQGTPVGGFGANATADLAVTPGQVLYIEVAGNGGNGTNATPGAAGVNGGGAGAGGGGGKGGGGGGASDVRTLPRSASSSLNSRLITAGGGGGGGSGASSGGAAGADGGDTGGGKAGTSTAGGAAGGGSATAGTLGSGGNGGFDTGSGGTSGGGGGGGGVYGGGGGNGGAMGMPGFGGGGGSTGFASGVTGTSSTTDTTGTPAVTLSYVPAPAPPDPTPPADTVRPTLRSLVLAPSAFVAANSGPSAVAAASVGTFVFFKLSETAGVTFTVQRAAAGIVRARTCIARPRRPPRGARPCTRYVAMAGSFAHAGTAGPNGLRFMGRLRGRSLPRGNYRLVASARDGAGNRSTPVRATFRIIR